MSTLERAIAIAAEAHAGQVDRAGAPYILHPLRVMLALPSEAERIVGVLHDVAEDDAGWTLDRLREAGFREAIVLALAELTRPPGHRYPDYIRTLVECGSALARRVKVVDLHDNLAPLRVGVLTGGHRQRYERALAELRASLADRSPISSEAAA